MTTTDDAHASDRSATTLATSAAPRHSPATDSGEEDAAPPQPPPLVQDDAYAKQLAKQRLFPRRVGPVKIGRFVVLQRIGSGAMGIVYACYDDHLDRKVAVKVLRTDSGREASVARARLLREAQAMARLTHPNIVTVHEVGAVDDEVFVAMEFVRGVSLDVWVEQAPRSWQEVRAAYLQTGRGLAAAHRGGIVHRDFKPHNAMMSEDGLVKVLDFGLARASDGGPEDSPASAPERAAQAKATLLHALTRTGAVIGTPAYMSPEQHRGEVATAKSDQFSFCVSLYQALYGTLPFSVASFEVFQRDVLAGRVAPAPPRSPVPARVYQALRRGMAAEPEQRFAAMEELLAALEPKAPPGRTIALVAAAGLLGGASFVFAASRGATSQCPDAHAELAGIWDTERAQAVRTAVRAAVPTAEEVLPRIERELTAYADAWAATRNDACRAHAEGRQSATLFDLRTACLDRRRASLRAVTETLAAPSPESRDHLLGAVVGLPPLEACADATALTAAVAPPDDPLLRARVNHHFESLARANVYMDTSQLRRARVLVEEVLADPEVRTYEPVLAQAYLYRGYLQDYDGELAPVVDTFNQALAAALSSGHDIVAAQASSARMAFKAAFMDRVAEAKAEAWLVTALNRRAQRDVDTYARYLHFMGALHGNDGDVEGGLRLWKEAVALREAHGRDRTREYFGTSMQLGTWSEALGRHAEAATHLRRTIDRAEEIFGPYYADWNLVERYLAYATIRLGRPREALARLQRILEARGDRMMSVVEGVYFQATMAHAELVLGEPAAAHRRLREALRGAPKETDRWVWALLAWSAGADGDAEGLQRAAAEALRDHDESAERRGLTHQEVLLRHGQALAALGRHEEALVPWTRAMAALAGSQRALDVFRRANLSLELAKARRHLAQFDAAERDLQEALAGFQQVLPPENLEIAETMLALAELALVRERPAESAEWLVQAESIFSGSAEHDYLPLVRTRELLAQVGAAATETGEP
ncbi:protein kinase domain-containing protein [Nannocystis pusilla]|uniref:serine/threonine-protein kinase n=1 Tax=Nannocystis pusilla TaxID=889268 RepID=UPI003DA1FF7F